MIVSWHIAIAQWLLINNKSRIFWFLYLTTTPSTKYKKVRQQCVQFGLG